MAPRSFSADGAQGAWGGGDTSSGALPGMTVNDPGPAGGGNTANTWETGSQALGDYTKAEIGLQDGTQSGGFSYSTGGPGGFSFRKNSAAQDDAARAWGSGMQNATPGTYTSGLNGFGFTPALADGGAVPDDGDGDAPDSTSQSNSGGDDLVSLALATVDSALKYGRQKYGLGGGDQQAGAMPTIPGNQSNTPGPYVPQRPKPQQQAGLMPSVPGNQSESGRPPIQPMPGPLPPTSNPFGKRTRLGDNSDQQGAIPDDQEEAA